MLAAVQERWRFRPSLLERRAMRFVIGLALVLLVSASVGRTPDRISQVQFRPIPLDRDRPERRRFGDLTLLGGWKLTSNNARFGGLSSMRITQDEFMALSDAAFVFEFNFDGHRSESQLRSRPLPGIYTSPEPDRDSESMTTDPTTGNMWVGFEASNSIRRFSPNLGEKRAWVAPRAMKHWSENGGPEGMVRLADGRFIVFSEDCPGPDESIEALLFPGDPILNGDRLTRFYYKPPRGFSATDDAQLPDGRVLVLNRFFSVLEGVSAALTLLDPREIKPGQIVPSRLVAMLAPPLNIDNMEAMAVEERDGKTIVWIASDDNFNPLQQTLLFKFALETAPQLKRP
jgi:hypothetical protein